MLWVADEEARLTAVLDLTHPAFSVTVDDRQLARLADDFARDAVHAAPLSPATRLALERSRLGRALVAASGTYLSGMGTYLLKLGPEALGPDADPLDRRLATSFPVLCIRIRLQDVVSLIVRGLQRPLAADAQRPLSLINIGGGPAADSFNTLLALQARYSTLLWSRRMEIAVLDIDESGPAFGGRVLEALRGAEQPLQNLSVSFRVIPYNWSERTIDAALRDVVDRSAITVVSSEGGVFEYGDDDVVIANLKSLHAATADDAMIVGSVARPGPTLDALGSARAVLRARSIDAFASLTTQAEWEIDEVIERPLCYAVRMNKANHARGIR